MRPYSKSDIACIYRQIVNNAHNCFSQRKYEKALQLIEAASEWMYQFNLFYRDDFAENIIRDTAKKNLAFQTIINPDRNNCVLIDSWCWDNKGLSQQYLRAMMQNKYNILYICTAKVRGKGDDILSELADYKWAKIVFVWENYNNRLQCAEAISKMIADFSANNVFLHITPFDTVALLACSVLKNVSIFNINLTDHAFWLGASFVDFNIEFRPYGLTVSLEKRGLKEEQLLPLPYYPVKSIKHPFLGLPELPDNVIKIFTGGALYKMLGRNDVFFRILEIILDISPNVYIIVAGFNKNTKFDRKIARIKGKERIIQIGRRCDIDAVFDNIDIYLSTYPMIGGLMSQYAAMHGKPIIAYHDENDSMNIVEEIVNNYQDDFKSFTNFDEMRNYAVKLINDTQYRANEGLILRQGLMTQERFADSLNGILLRKVKLWVWSKDRIDYDSFFERYLELENSNGFEATERLAVRLKLNSVKILKGYRSSMLSTLIKCGVNIIKSKLGK